jgi:hypothetical protein
MAQHNIEICGSKSHLLKVTQTVHYQQTSLLEAQGVVDPDPRKIFIDDLIDLVKTQEKGSAEHVYCDAGRK